MIKSKPYQSSFRDNKNFVFKDGDKIKRQINPLGFEDFRQLVDSGLYDELISKNSWFPIRWNIPEAIRLSSVRNKFRSSVIPMSGLFQCLRMPLC